MSQFLFVLSLIQSWMPTILRLIKTVEFLIPDSPGSGDEKLKMVIQILEAVFNNQIAGQGISFDDIKPALEATISNSVSRLNKAQAWQDTPIIPNESVSASNQIAP
jgi:hypothetical protein